MLKEGKVKIGEISIVVWLTLINILSLIILLIDKTTKEVKLFLTGQKDGWVSGQ